MTDNKEPGYAGGERPAAPKRTPTWRAARVFVENAPDQWHVYEGRCGVDSHGRITLGESIAVCKDEVIADLMAAVPEMREALLLVRVFLGTKYVCEQLYQGGYGDRANALYKRIDDVLNQAQGNKS